MKKFKLSLLASIIAVPAIASNFVIIIDDKDNSYEVGGFTNSENDPDWTVVDTTCSYDKEEADIYYGHSYEQTVSCIEELERTITITRTYEDGTTEVVGTRKETDSRPIPDTTQTITGIHLEASCKAILDNNYSNGDGVYQIQPVSSNYPVYCDMTNDGGGWTMIIGFKGDGLDLSYYDDTNVGWTSTEEVGTFKNTDLNYASGSEYFSKAYSELNADHIRITNDYDRLTWNTPKNDTLKSFIDGNNRVVYSATDNDTGWTFNNSLSYKRSDNSTNLAWRWGNTLKTICQDGRANNTDNAILGFKSNYYHSGYYCEGFGYPDFGDHTHRYNTRFHSEVIGTNVSYQATGWAVNPSYYNVWIK